MLAFFVTPSLVRGYRNIYLLSIDYAFQPHLRSRLTQGGRTFPWKPWAIGVTDSHRHFATHTGILTSILPRKSFDSGISFVSAGFSIGLTKNVLLDASVQFADFDDTLDLYSYGNGVASVSQRVERVQGMIGVSFRF